MSPLIPAGLALAAVAGAYFYGVRAGHDQCEAQSQREQKIGEMAAAKAADVAASAISGIEVKNVFNEKQILREVRTNTVYADCRHTPAGLSSINAALTNKRAESAGGGQLPAASAPGR